MKRRNFLKLFGVVAAATAVPTLAIANTKAKPIPLDKSKRLQASFSVLFDTELHGKYRLYVHNKDVRKNRNYGWSHARRFEFGVEPDETVSIETESGLLHKIVLRPVVYNGKKRWQHVYVCTQLFDGGFNIDVSHINPI